MFTELTKPNKFDVLFIVKHAQTYLLAGVNIRVFIAYAYVNSARVLHCDVVYPRVYARYGVVVVNWSKEDHRSAAPIPAQSIVNKSV